MEGISGCKQPGEMKPYKELETARTKLNFTVQVGNKKLSNRRSWKLEGGTSEEEKYSSSEETERNRKATAKFFRLSHLDFAFCGGPLKEILDGSAVFHAKRSLDVVLGVFHDLDLMSGREIFS